MFGNLNEASDEIVRIVRNFKLLIQKKIEEDKQYCWGHGQAEQSEAFRVKREGFPFGENLPAILPESLNCSK